MGCSGQNLNLKCLLVLVGFKGRGVFFDADPQNSKPDEQRGRGQDPARPRCCHFGTQKRQFVAWIWEVVATETGP